MKDTLGNLAIDLLQLEYCHDRLDVEVMALQVMGQQRDDTHQARMDKLGRDIRALRARLLRLADGTPRGSIGQLAACPHGHAICSICHTGASA